MATQTDSQLEQDLYPDCDGQPMSDNTLQFRWIMTLQGNLDGLFSQDPNVFVAGDLLWYAQQGEPTVRVAPDVLVAFGRPKGYRGSYRQWQEAGIAPQVVFEVLSPGNTEAEMERKWQFYDEHEVEEYYLYDPDSMQLMGWLRREGSLRPITKMHNWVSPRLGVRFDLSGEELAVHRPDGTRFLTFTELLEQAENDRRQREQAEHEAEAERRQREQAQRETATAQARAERLAAKLRELGIDPDA